jgi:phosphatidate cytidylyltransferase
VAQHQPIRRILSAVLFIPILLYCLFSHSRYPWALGILVTFVSLLGTREFYHFVKIKGFSPFCLFGYLMVLFFCGGGIFWPYFASPTQITIFLILGSFLFGIYKYKPENNHSLLRISTTVLGVLYVAFPLSLLLYIWQIPRGEYYLLWLVAVTWFCDTGAYAVGSIFGKHKLCPAISPNKTIEGAIGGILFSIGIALLTTWILQRYYLVWLFRPLVNVLLAIIIAGIGQLGDLAESILKREVALKDSGNTFTGHGGILDIIDSLLFTGPALYLILKFYY